MKYNIGKYKDRDYYINDCIDIVDSLTKNISQIVSVYSIEDVYKRQLLGIEIVNLKSAPVGSLRTMKLYPLDFEEFLQLFNINDKAYGLLKSAYEGRSAVDEMIHNKMLQIFNLYLIIGCLLYTSWGISGAYA